MRALASGSLGYNAGGALPVVGGAYASQRDERMPPDLPDATAAVGVTEPLVTGSALPAPEAAAPPGQQPCPRCGHLMPDLKGGTASICAVCGFKDSCCF